MIWIRVRDERLLRVLCIKVANESMTGVDSSVPFIVP